MAIPPNPDSTDGGAPSPATISSSEPLRPWPAAPLDPNGNGEPLPLGLAAPLFPNGKADCDISRIQIEGASGGGPRPVPPRLPWSLGGASSGGGRDLHPMAMAASSPVRDLVAPFSLAASGPPTLGRRRLLTPMDLKHGKQVAMRTRQPSPTPTSTTDEVALPNPNSDAGGLPVMAVASPWCRWWQRWRLHSSSGAQRLLALSDR
ncbi:uncharacterized protein [Miscanthus floridulus]|uniref:uncharacterized protein n=1 Tax=Miscanthus floridulus TaxID=154761 RepID=UPI0034582FD2